MKICLDPAMIRSRPVEDVFRIARDAGYRYLEFTWRDDFLPSRHGRQPSFDTIKRIAKSSEDSGVAIASIMTIYEWSSPDEQIRKEAVKYWKSAIQVTNDLGCNRLNTEFSGDRFNPLVSERSFLRSAEELDSILKEKAVQIYIEPHPGDFVENGDQAAHILRGLHSDRFGYLLCAPHTFYLGGSLQDQIRNTKDILGHVHLADTFKPTRVILNPWADVRIHEHLDLGQGEIDWKVFFNTLAEISYNNVMTVAIFAWPEQAVESYQKNYLAVMQLLKESKLVND
jgi:myo-inositol catabolism protein IolH